MGCENYREKISLYFVNAYKAQFGISFEKYCKIITASIDYAKTKGKQKTFTDMQKRLDISGFIVYNQCKVKCFTLSLKFCRNGGVPMGKNLEISLLLDFYGEMLTEKQRDMVDYYYNDDLSLSEIAENEGITRQGVRDSIKRAEAQMLEMEERLGLARRFRKISADIEEIYTLAQTIRQYSAFPGCPSEVSDSAARIMVLASMLEKAE